nr:aminoglycoside phosphotransferase family protein [Methylomarinum sp. Ch1-1]MDP4522568.1 aminoglycoside phosphotransferase family protein [Methylomarinum sp. Ch1-1]
MIENLQCIGRHLQSLDARMIKLTLPALLQTAAGDYGYRDPAGDFWRALALIEHGQSRECLSRRSEAGQTGFALAHFHRLFSNLEPGLLHDTLPGFHVTPGYLRHYDQVAAASAADRKDESVVFCRRFIDDYRDKCDVLENARRQGLLRERIIHGDPKLNNFLFAGDADSIISLIDLDTVKPGLVHYDIGDCLRSCCHIKRDHRFDLDLCASVLENYLREAGSFSATPITTIYMRRSS